MHPIYTHIRQVLSATYPDTEASAMAKSILLDIFQFTQAELYAGKDTDFGPKEAERLEDILERLKRYEPLQYIIGETTFCGLTFKVSPDVLIPRPETAELIEWIQTDHREERNLRILDIGTGSGCIPIALAKSLPDAQVSAWDISEQALRTAEENAQRNDARVSFTKVDVLKDGYPPVCLDVLVSNPPYITESERKDMNRNVLDWEPNIALFVPNDKPLLFYERIADIGLHTLRPGGSLFFEINQAYGPDTVQMLREKGYQQVSLRKDMSGNDRMIKAIRP